MSEGAGLECEMRREEERRGDCFELVDWFDSCEENEGEMGWDGVGMKKGKKKKDYVQLDKPLLGLDENCQYISPSPYVPVYLVSRLRFALFEKTESVEDK